MSKGRQRRPIPPPPRPKAVEPPDAFEGQIYRVKRALVKLEVDLFNADGKYLDTTYTDPPIPLAEADWPAGFERVILSKTPNLKRGFRGDIKKAKPPVERDAETA